MKNTFGSALTVTLFGESHGEAIGAVIDGLTPGIEIDLPLIKKRLDMRRPHGKISTARREADEPEFLSGIFEGKTTGTPLAFIIKNCDQKSRDYSEFKSTPRPSHADYSAECKYHGYQDYRGGGHFSGRLTAAIVCAGAIIEGALRKLGIKIGTHIADLHGILDRPFTSGEGLTLDIDSLNEATFPVLDPKKGDEMVSLIEKCRSEGDSVGGILESCVTGLPAGLGEPYFDSIESTVSHILFSIPGIKGVEFGRGFGFSELFGSEANDPFVTNGDTVLTATNNSGGINGGITNGMPMTVRCAVRPTPSIYKPQKTVDINTKTEKEIKIEGRHDPAIIHRARAVVDACLAIAVGDILTVRYGSDALIKR